MAIVIPVLVLLALYGLALIVIPMVSPRPDGLGASEGRFNQPCPNKPNCVSSQADPDDSGHYIAPMPFDGSTAEARTRLIAVIDSLPRSRIITQEDHYLHVEFRSLLWRFIDDTEFIIDATSGQVHVRSAARLGYSDMGVNRARVESIRKAFAAS